MKGCEKECSGTVGWLGKYVCYIGGSLYRGRYGIIGLKNTVGYGGLRKGSFYRVPLCQNWLGKSGGNIGKMYCSEHFHFWKNQNKQLSNHSANLESRDARPVFTGFHDILRPTLKPVCDAVILRFE